MNKVFNDISRYSDGTSHTPDLTLSPSMLHTSHTSVRTGSAVHAHDAQPAAGGARRLQGLGGRHRRRRHQLPRSARQGAEVFIKVHPSVHQHISVAHPLSPLLLTGPRETRAL